MGDTAGTPTTGTVFAFSGAPAMSCRIPNPLVPAHHRLDLTKTLRYYKYKHLCLSRGSLSYRITLQFITFQLLSLKNQDPLGAIPTSPYIITTRSTVTSLQALHSSTTPYTVRRGLVEPSSVDSITGRVQEQS